MSPKDICYLSVIFMIIAVTALHSFQQKGKQRNYVLASKAVLQDLFDEAGALLEEHPHLASRFAHKIREFNGLFRKIYNEIDDRSMDICWTTKKKEVCILERSLENIVSEISIIAQEESDDLASVQSSEA